MTTGYAKTQEASLGSGPAQLTEAWALTTTARKLQEAKERPDDIDGLLHAVRLNWRLWTIFQAELTEPTCGLPVDLRSNLLNLSNFVDKISVGIFADPGVKDLDTLININRQIASGLSESGRRAQEDERKRLADAAAAGGAAAPQTVVRNTKA